MEGSPERAGRLVNLLREEAEQGTVNKVVEISPRSERVYQ